MDVIGLLKEGIGLVREQWHYWTGGRSREQIRLESEIEDLYVQKHEALNRRDVVAANQYELDIQRLRREIAAKFPFRS